MCPARSAPEAGTGSAACRPPTAPATGPRAAPGLQTCRAPPATAGHPQLSLGRGTQERAKVGRMLAARRRPSGLPAFPHHGQAHQHQTGHQGAETVLRQIRRAPRRRLPASEQTQEGWDTACPLSDVLWPCGKGQSCSTGRPAEGASGDSPAGPGLPHAPRQGHLVHTNAP